jgi:hypothetical protein
MTLRDRVLAWAVAGLLAVGPAYAQQAQGTDVTGSSSDVSGTLTQSDAYLFQTDESRIRMADVAASLTDALRNGRLDQSVVGGRSMTVSPETAALFLADSEAEKEAAIQHVTAALTEKGLPLGDARALAERMAGLLTERAAPADAFLAAVNAFNNAVDAAPAGFLVEPPSEFTVARAVLLALLEGAAI